MHMDIWKKDNNIEELHAFCQAMIDASYSPAYCPAAVAMLKAYHSPAQILEDAASGRVWAARDEAGGIIATVTVAEAEVRRMFVHPSLRGRGVGRMLMDRAFEYAWGTGIRKLTAWSVPFSRGFYEKAGFRMLNADTLDFNYRREIPVPYIEMAAWPAGTTDIEIGPAGAEDIAEMLAGQKISFEEQCRIYDDWQIPPMTEQARDVTAFMAGGGVILKAVIGGRIAGAVRGRAAGPVCDVGRLYVLPEYQGRGAARMLIAALEETMGDVRTFSIFTGERSEKNIALYQKQGYELTGRRAKAKSPSGEGGYDLVWLEKPNPWPEIEGSIRRVRMV